MFSDPQFWVAVSFLLFILLIFNPVRKVLTSNLDSQIREIKEKIDEAENIKNEAQNALNELNTRKNEVQKEIQELKLSSETKILQLKELSSKKLSEQVDKRKLLAENKINQLVRDTNFTVKSYISNVSIQATIHILKNNLSKDKKLDLINESIKEIDNIL